MINIIPVLNVVAPKLNPNAKQDWADALMPAMEQSNINTVKRIAMFLSQCAVESEYFTKLEEDLNYSSAEEIYRIWPNEFPSIYTAQQYVNLPEALANRAYAKKNGNSQVGDGWKFRGRGLFQLSGRDNYLACWKAIAPTVNFETVFPDLLLTHKYAAASATYFWSTKNKGLNLYADQGLVAAVSRSINGSSTNLLERVKLYNLSIKSLMENKVPEQIVLTSNSLTADDLNQLELDETQETDDV